MSASTLEIIKAPQPVIIPHPVDASPLTFDRVFLINVIAFQTVMPPLSSVIGQEITIQERTYVVLWSAMRVLEHEDFFVGLVEKVEGIKDRVLLAKQTITADPKLKGIQDEFTTDAKQAAEKYPTEKKIRPKMTQEIFDLCIPTVLNPEDSSARLNLQKTLMLWSFTTIHKIDNLRLVSNYEIMNIRGLLEKIEAIYTADNPTISDKSKKDLIQYGTTIDLTADQVGAIIDAFLLKNQA